MQAFATLLTAIAALVSALNVRAAKSDNVQLSRQSGIFLTIILGLVFVGLGFDFFERAKSPPWYKVIDAFDVPVLVYDDNLRILYTNSEAKRFYKVEQLQGMHPEALHEFIKPYMPPENYEKWATEQMRRKRLASQVHLSSKTKVPMMLEEHPNFSGPWYLTSRPITIDEKTFYVTRFSRTPGEP